MTNENFSIEGISPRKIELPSNLDDLARVVADAAKENAAIIPWGGGTMQHLGGVPRRYDIALQTARLNRVLEYSPDDLTITVEAGITLAALQEELAARNQFLPLDPPLPQRATMGGILATNSSETLRVRYGSPRDFTLGMRVVNAEGKVLKFGGKVVKNVAGYEMAKLHVGSLGTLGIITEATFKVLPKPPQGITCIASFADHHAACNAARALWNLTTWPLALELLGARLAHALKLESNENTFVVAARFAGTRAVVEAAASKADHAARANRATRFDAIPDLALWQRIADLPTLLRDAHPLGALARIGVPPAQLNATLDKIAERAQTLKIDPPQLFAHAATATIYVALEGSDNQLVEAIKHLRWALAPLQAHVIVQAAPRAVKEKIEVWGEPGAEHPLMQRIKAQFDPQMIFNAGRFIGGL